MSSNFGSYSPPPRSEIAQEHEQYIDGIYHIERQLFLRAALQLLDEKESAAAGHITPQQAISIPRLFRSDVIRFGRLKKANRRNALTTMAPRVWKTKIVEIKYGIFYYEDEYVSKADTGETVSRKSIVLCPSTTTCRDVRTKGVHENCIFQLATVGGAKRTFLAESQEDRDAWMKAIITAMPVIPSIKNLTYASPPVDTFNQRINSLINFKPGKRENGRASLKHVNDSPDLLMIVSQSSLPGPAAKYAQDISHFCNQQARIVSAETAEEYRKAVLSLRESNTTIRVPVFFVKSIRPPTDESHDFYLAPEDALNSHTVNTLSTSQIWKDLQRDKVSINDELVAGQSRGAESIIAALTRHIMVAAQTTRRVSQSPLNQSVDTANIGNTAMSGTNTPRTDTGKPKEIPKSPTKDTSKLNYFSKLTKRIVSASPDTEYNTPDNFFSLRESQALACAKEVLVLCNRTQSGGDTYFCIQSFLAKCGLEGRAQEHLCVLTPLESHSEPLEISVNVGYYTPGSEIRIIDHNQLGSPFANNLIESAHNIAAIRESIKRSQHSDIPTKVKFNQLSHKFGITNTDINTMNTMATATTTSASSIRSQQVLEQDTEMDDKNSPHNKRSDTLSSTDTTVDSQGSGRMLVHTNSGSWMNKIRSTVSTTTYPPSTYNTGASNTSLTFDESIYAGPSYGSMTGPNATRNSPLVKDSVLSSIIQTSSTSSYNTTAATTGTASELQRMRVTSVTSTITPTFSSDDLKKGVVGGGGGEYSTTGIVGAGSISSHNNSNNSSLYNENTIVLSRGRTQVQATKFSPNSSFGEDPRNSFTTTGTNLQDMNTFKQTSFNTNKSETTFKSDTNSTSNKEKRVGESIHNTKSSSNADNTSTTSNHQPKITRSRQSAVPSTIPASIEDDDDIFNRVDVHSDDGIDDDDDDDDHDTETMMQEVEDDDFSIVSELQLDDITPVDEEFNRERDDTNDRRSDADNSTLISADNMDPNSYQSKDTLLDNTPNSNTASNNASNTTPGTSIRGNTAPKVLRTSHSEKVTSDPSELAALIDKEEWIHRRRTASGIQRAAVTAMLQSGSGSGSGSPTTASNDNRFRSKSDRPEDSSGSGNSGKNSATIRSKSDVGIQTSGGGGGAHTGSSSSSNNTSPNYPYTSPTTPLTSPYHNHPHPSSSSGAYPSSHDIMEYEVKPRTASFLFKPKSFKIFDGGHKTFHDFYSSSTSTSSHPIAASSSNSNSNSMSSNTHHILKSQFPLDSIVGSTSGQTNSGGSSGSGNNSLNTNNNSVEIIHRRKSSLSGIYESQLNSLSTPKNPELVISIVVKAESMYRLCCADPQGDDSDNWATIFAVFQQTFLIHSDSQGVPTSMDREVTLQFDRDIRKISI